MAMMQPKRPSWNIEHVSIGEFFFKSYNFCDQPTTFLQSTFSVPIGRLRHSRLLGIIYKEYLNHGYVSVLPLMVPQTRARVAQGYALTAPIAPVSLSEEPLVDVPEGEIESNWDQIVDK